MTKLVSLLANHRDTLVRYFEKNATPLRRYEAAEDLAQGVHLHAIKHGERFEYQGEPQFIGWLLALARQHLSDRIAHWKALKRDAGPMLRITFSGAGIEPPATETGPVTHASRNEQIQRATLAMAGLPARDRALVRMMSAGLDIEAIASSLNISPAAAQRARLRAMERFRKVYALIRDA